MPHAAVGSAVLFVLEVSATWDVIAAATVKLSESSKASLPAPIAYRALPLDTDRPSDIEHGQS